MRYAPRTFTIATILSIIGLASMLFLVLFRRRIDQRLMAYGERLRMEPATLQVPQAPGVNFNRPNLLGD
jgi:hypothetical protein